MTRLSRDAMPPLYAILDAEAVQAAGRELAAVAQELRAAGVELLQYRDKRATAEVVLANARMLRVIFAHTAILVLNDAPALCVQAGWDGVHVGQGDMPVAAARRIVGEDRIVGVSTHAAVEVKRADASDADYIAIGPVFATRSKSDTEAEVGLDGISEARRLTRKPLVAIGGITTDRMPAVLRAGADAAAVISALLAPGATVTENVMRLRQSA